MLLLVSRMQTKRSRPQRASTQSTATSWHMNGAPQQSSLALPASSRLGPLLTTQQLPLLASVVWTLSGNGDPSGQDRGAEWNYLLEIEVIIVVWKEQSVIQRAHRDRGLESRVKLAAGQTCHLTHSDEEEEAEEREDEEEEEEKCSRVLRGSEFLLTRFYLSTLFCANCEEEARKPRQNQEANFKRRDWVWIKLKNILVISWQDAAYLMCYLLN